MLENEVIVVNGIDTKAYDKIVEDAIRYAILSIPFTYDRMGIPDLKQKIINIAKGKVAEGLFSGFCQANNILLNIEKCTTPFYQADRRDFLLNGLEWDIKNNFLYHEGELLTDHPYTELPALIPNRGAWDQWGKLQKKMVSDTNGTACLFTFLKNRAEYKKGKNFLQINLSSEQENLIRFLYKKYGGKHQDSEPFSADRFWKKFDSPGNLSYELIHRPCLIICAYANQHYWQLFKDTSDGIRKFPNDKYATLTTTINNRSCLIKNLPSFLSLFPQSKRNLNDAIIKL